MWKGCIGNLGPTSCNREDTIYRYQTHHSRGGGGLESLLNPTVGRYIINLKSGRRWGLNLSTHLKPSPISQIHCLWTELFFLSGIRGNGYTGDIAVDDISFGNDCKLAGGVIPTSEPPVTTKPPTPKPNNCRADQFGCWKDGKCIDKTKVCDFTIDCDDDSDERFCRKSIRIIATFRH